MAVPIPDLNLNLNLAATTGDFDKKSSTSQTFGAPVINKTDWYKVAGVAGAVLAAAIVAKKTGLL